MIGALAETPLELEGGGRWYLDPSTATPWRTFETDAEGSFLLELDFPSGAGLCGITLAVQGLLLDGRGGPHTSGAVTDALLVTPGD